MISISLVNWILWLLVEMIIAALRRMPGKLNAYLESVNSK
jgi:hypothetical protein